MKSNRIRLVSISSALLVVSSGGVAFGQFDEILRRVPGDANVLMIIDAEKVHASPIAIREGWKDKQAETYAQSPLSIPPEAQRFVSASRIDTRTMRPAWEVALIEEQVLPSLALLARAEQGFLDKVGDIQVVWSPSDAYFAHLTPTILGIYHPADRQYLSRWIKPEPGSRNSLSLYLRMAARKITSGPQIILAMDLKDVVGAREIRDKLANTGFMKNENVDSLIPLLASIKGITLQVTLSDSATGKIEVSFGSDAAALKNVAKALLLHVLDNHGAHLDGLEKWNVAVNSETVALDGPLSKSALRRILSIIEPPSPVAFAAGDGGKSEPSEEESPAVASKRYFRSIAALTEDLSGQVSQSGTDHASAKESAVWMSRYARKIDRLPILNVDNDLLNYGLSVSGMLREASNTVDAHRRTIKARNAGRTVLTGGRGYYGNYYSGANYNRYQRAQSLEAAAEEIAAAAEQARAIMKEIYDMTASIRVEMTQRYNLQF